MCLVPPTRQGWLVAGPGRLRLPWRAAPTAARLDGAQAPCSSQRQRVKPFRRSDSSPDTAQQALNHRHCSADWAAG